MKARIIDPQVKVYASMDANTLSIATLQEGSEIEFGGTKRKAGKLWLPITLSTGQQAYLPAETRVFIIREGLVTQTVDLHTEPSAGSLIRQQIPRNTRLSILKVVKEADQDWVKVRDATGNEGYIPGDTRIKIAPLRTKAMARKNLISGGMWLVAGVIMLYSETSSSSGSGFGLLGYGALIFGVIMLISGLVQYFTART